MVPQIDMNCVARKKNMSTNGKRPPFFICSSNPLKVPLASYSQPFHLVNCNSLSSPIANRFRLLSANEPCSRFNLDAKRPRTAEIGFHCASIEPQSSGL